MLSTGKIMFFELEKIMTAPNDVSFYLGRRDNHKISLNNIFPSFNDVININEYVGIYAFFIIIFIFIDSRVVTKGTFIFAWNAS